MLETYNEYHLGDNLIHLNYLRRLQLPLGEDIVHHCNPMHHKQLLPLTEGTAITLADLYIPPTAVNAWIGRDNYFYTHPLQSNWVLFHLSWFDHLSNLLGIDNPIVVRSDLLFEYSALNAPLPMSFDTLVINAEPKSNQLPTFSHEFFNKRVKELLNAGKRVITTNPTGMCLSTLEMGMDITAIGSLSKYCTHIEGVATGPMWTTFNVFNLDNIKSRVLYCDIQTVNLTDNTITKNRLS